jgi:hypothetical protein
MDHVILSNMFKYIYLRTHLSVPKGVIQPRSFSKTTILYQNSLAMRKTADVTGNTNTLHDL